MPSRLRAVVMSVALSSVAAGVAQAQTSRAHFGPHIAYNFDAEKLGIGAQFSAPIGRRLEFYPSFDYYFVDPGSLWALNADLKYRFAGQRLDWLYVGSGLDMMFRDVRGVTRTNAGLNLLFGVESLKGLVHPFGEARLILGDGSTFQVAGGLNITLGRH